MRFRDKPSLLRSFGSQASQLRNSIGSIGAFSSLNRIASGPTLATLGISSALGA